MKRFSLLHYFIIEKEFVKIRNEDVEASLFRDKREA